VLQKLKGLAVPADSAREAAVVQGSQVYGFQHVSEVADFLNQPDRHQALSVNGLEEMARSRFQSLDLKGVKGQSQARRALKIAAAGRHDLVLSTAKRLKCLL
jgi:magnesium chelatase family protein